MFDFRDTCNCFDFFEFVERAVDMSTVLSPFLTSPKLNKGVHDKICESRSRIPPADYYRSKSARRIESELLADAYCHIIADRCRSGMNLRRSENVDYNMKFRSTATQELREVLREINDSSFFNRTDASSELRSLERKADSYLDDYRYVGGDYSTYRYNWRSRII